MASPWLIPKKHPKLNLQGCPFICSFWVLGAAACLIICIRGSTPLSKQIQAATWCWCAAGLPRCSMDICCCQIRAATWYLYTICTHIIRTNKDKKTHLFETCWTWWGIVGTSKALDGFLPEPICRKSCYNRATMWELITGIGSHGSLGAPETVVAIIVFFGSMARRWKQNNAIAVIFLHPLCGKKQFAIPSEVVDGWNVSESNGSALHNLHLGGNQAHPVTTWTFNRWLTGGLGSRYFARKCFGEFQTTWPLIISNVLW